MLRVLQVFAGSVTCLAVYGCWRDWHARRWRQRTAHIATPERRDLQYDAVEAERNATLMVELALAGDDRSLCLDAMDLIDAAIEAREAADAALAREHAR